jgi:uncharacterized protein
MPVRLGDEDLPTKVQRLKDVWIPLSDGTRLSATVWLPEDAALSPVPTILEYLPYRKSDATAIDDSVRHPYFAAHGYASVRVDIRGTGDSEGILLDEYHPKEQEDALEVLRWLAGQPWCSGAVGMMGISWGGFNSLQIAARRPPELKAIISACSTDDRYADDVHYIGGTVLSYYMLLWASVMLAYSARPPDPLVVGDRWRDLWRQRLEHNSFLIEPWLSHQRRDDYWKQGSVCEDYSSITCPVYLVGGWSDGYTNAIFRLLEGLSCPRKALIGPWEHVWPEEGVPGPAIGFLQEALRWWDRWLKGIDTGIMNEPTLRCWMQDAVPPKPSYEERPGRWIAEPSWPSASISTDVLQLGPGTLQPGQAAPAVLFHSSPQTVGLGAGSWLPYGNPAHLPIDQRGDDAGSLCFDTAPFDRPVELLGMPEALLVVESSQPRAFLAVRLCDLAPDGTSALITRGILNLCHRDSHEHPTLLEPHRPYRVRLPLKAIAYSLPPGHRLRLAISTSYWPWVWPSPEPVTIGVQVGNSSALRLPVRPARPEDDHLIPFEPPETATPLHFEWLRPRSPELTIVHDVASGRVDYRERRSLWGGRKLPDGLEYLDDDPLCYTIVEDDPLSAAVRCNRTIDIGRGTWRTRVEVATTMSATRESFLITGHLTALEGDEGFYARSYSLSIPRDLG